MSTTRATPKRTQATKLAASSPTAKKKCVRRISPISEHDHNNIGAKTSKGIGVQGIHGLTITPVNNATLTSTTSTTSRKTVETPPSNKGPMVVVCKKCLKHSYDLKTCDGCHSHIPANSQRFIVKKVNNDVPSVVVTKNITTTSTIEKKIIYNYTDMRTEQKSSFLQKVQGKMVFEASSTPLSARGGKGRPKTRRKAEPVCYTLSSDEEETRPMQGTSLHASQIYPVELEGTDHSSGSEIVHDEHIDSDDPQYPGVTDINPNLDFEEEPDEEMEYDGEEMMEEEEEEPLEVCPLEEEEEMLHIEDEEEDEEEQNHGTGEPTDYPLKCRSIRIGSYKVHPSTSAPFIPVVLQHDSISFHAPVILDQNRLICITLGSDDIQKMEVHFGRCLPIIFIYTSATFGDLVRNALKMTLNQTPYFDPSAKDDKTQKLTFLIEAISEDQKTYIRQKFPGDKKVIEIDQKTANEILVRSTPSTQNQMQQLVKVNRSEPAPSPISVTQEIRLPQVSSQISVTKVTVPPQPVVKLLIYPGPPLLDSIAITNEDLNCLNEGEFLNDAIIDFYLKYLFQEKLSQSFRDKVHIFSSFFYPRLTHRPERARAGDNTNNPLPVRRHNQVKTWTRHVDIFSKDYIIIPVNQNVHWFLAIIMHPNRVPDAPNVPENKLSGSATSTDEPEHVNKVTIKEITSNGEDDSPIPDDNSMNSDNSPYEVEEPPDSDEGCIETADNSTHPDGKQRKEMPCICIFDSLSGPSRYRIATVLREYLEMEWKSKKGTKKQFDKNTMQGFIMRCPQQQNYSDCGIYLLQYVESFFENTHPLGTPMPDLTDWFTEEKVNKKRQQLKDLILSLKRKQEAANAAASRSVSNRSQPSSSRQQNDNR